MGELSIDPQRVAEGIEGFLRQQLDAFRREGVILGLSGGLDSAVVAALAARALGPEKVLALILPERDSDPRSKKDALVLARQWVIRHRVINLTPLLALSGVYWRVPLWLIPSRRLRGWAVRRYASPLAGLPTDQLFAAGLPGGSDRGIPWLHRGYAYIRIKHRLRMALLYYHAESENRLVLGTCNRTEWLTGFFVRYGDAAADIAPILPLYKTQVRQLAVYLDIPQDIVAKPPSPDLLPGVTDEWALGLSYDILDRILWRLERGVTAEDIAAELGIALEKVHSVADLVRLSKPLREAPPFPTLELRQPSL